uniref:Pentatricopeptide repeat-containing protein At4g02750-like n=3 Tax=Cicer arietinum TaxID=3827 RepID=A0A1S2YFN1_CICAR|nr:pentatricopeptide repeat-containing protein At4g02750-like [Cicer arietinum]
MHTSLVPISLKPSPFHRHSFRLFSAQQHVYRINLTITSLSRAGNINAARHLFDKTSTKDIVTWNSMLTAYWQNGLLQHSKSLFQSMPHKNVVSWNSIITACVQNNNINDAFKYFTAMPEKNAASYNAMISGFVKNGHVEQAQKLFEEMPRPNVVSYTVMIDGYAKMENGIKRAKALFDAMPFRNEVSWTVMISGLVENGLYEEAWELFVKMPQKNVVACTAMITGFCKQGKVDEAWNLFQQISCRDIASWNIMITGYAQNGRGEEALNLFSQMVRTGMQPDDLTFVSLFTACASLALLEEGRQTNALVVKHGFDSDLSVSNALVTMYSKCGEIVKSELAFGQISHPDIVSWNTIIAAFAQHGLYDRSRYYFDHMVTVGVTPDGITFLNLLSACCRAGKVDETVYLFNLMVHNYGIPPRSEHYSCIIDVMSRAGQLQRACQLIQEMPFKADSSIWSALLVGCNIHSNVQLGELAARNILNLDPYNSGAYVMLSNIYAAAGKWKDVNRVRVLMKEQGVKKQRAYSWMQIGNKLHCFVGGDPSHPNIDDIHVALRRITLHMKVKGNFEEAVS